MTRDVSVAIPPEPRGETKVFLDTCIHSLLPRWTPNEVELAARHSWWDAMPRIAQI